MLAHIIAFISAFAIESFIFICIVCKCNGMEWNGNWNGIGDSAQCHNFKFNLNLPQTYGTGVAAVADFRQSYVGIHIHTYYKCEQATPGK